MYSPIWASINSQIIQPLDNYLPSKWQGDDNLCLSEQKGEKTDDGWIINDKRQYELLQISGI